MYVPTHSLYQDGHIRVLVRLLVHVCTDTLSLPRWTHSRACKIARNVCTDTLSLPRWTHSRACKIARTCMYRHTLSTKMDTFACLQDCSYMYVPTNSLYQDGHIRVLVRLLVHVCTDTLSLPRWTHSRACKIARTCMYRHTLSTKITQKQLPHDV